jgi:hypothetical protein
MVALRRAVVMALVTALGLGGCATMSRRWSEPVTVREVVLLSEHGVPPEQIVAKMRRAGTIYHLDAAPYATLRTQAVTPVVIGTKQASYAESVRAHPQLAGDVHLDCWSLGFDGVWYAGGPFGFHPDCARPAPAP